MLINKQLCTVEQHCVLACWSTLFYSSWTIATFPFFPIILFRQSRVFFHKLIIHFIHYGDQCPKIYQWSTVGDDTVDQVPIMGCLSTGGDDTVDQLRWCLQWSSHLFFPTQYLPKVEVLLMRWEIFKRSLLDIGRWGESRGELKEWTNGWTPMRWWTKTVWSSMIHSCNLTSLYRFLQVLSIYSSTSQCVTFTDKNKRWMIKPTTTFCV